jgi:hypothetical protein
MSVQQERYSFDCTGIGNVGIKVFNKLAETINRLEKIQEFKRRLKYFLLHHTFYSLDEYILYCLLLFTFYL